MATRDEIRKLVESALSKSDSGVNPSANVEHVVVNSLKNDVDKKWDRDESAKRLLTEDDFRGLEMRSTVRVAAQVQLTALAKDIVSDLELTLIPKETRTEGLKVSSVAIGCDHGGYETKEELKKCLTDLGVKVRDFGTDSKEAVDYPDFAYAVARSVSENAVEVGIVIDGAGIGSAMAANKVVGIHAAACYSTALARNSREHNGANVLTLGSGQNTIEEIKEIVKAFLSSEITEVRHKKRVKKIDAIEGQYRKR